MNFTQNTTKFTPKNRWYESPFGVLLDERSKNGGKYRYSYQGSEQDNEVKGKGNSYTTFFRQLDPRIGRWLSIDPKKSAWESPYVSMGNNPIMFNDVLGDTIKIEGSKRFQRIVQREIRRLMKTDAGRDLLKSLHERTDNIKITKQIPGNGNETTVSSGNIKLDPTSRKGGMNEKGKFRRPRFIGLAHEMKHSLEILDGNLSWTNFVAPDGFSKGDYEFSATQTENQIRAEFGIALREYYGNGPGNQDEILLIDANKIGTHPSYRTSYKTVRKNKARISKRSAKNYINDPGVRRGGWFRTSKRMDIKVMKYAKD